MRKSLLMLLIATLMAAGVGGAQTPTVDPGARIRFAFPPGTPLTIATALAQRGDSLWVRPLDSADTVALALPGLARLDVSAGRQTHAWRGAGIGLLVGAAVGGVLGYAAGSDCPTSQGSGYFNFNMCFGRGFYAEAGALGLGTVGAVIGAVSGWVNPTERWDAVRLPAGGTMALRFDPGGRRAGIAIGWPIPGRHATH